MVYLKLKSMEDKKGRNCDHSNDWCSQGGINQKRQDYPGRAKTRSKRALPGSKMIESPYTLSPPPLANAISDVPDHNYNKNDGLVIAGIIIGSFIILSIIIYGLIRFARKKKKDDSSKSQEEEPQLPGGLPINHRALTINFVKHNHHAPELCTTPDTQPILDYYSSKAGLSLSPSSLGSINGNKNSKTSADEKCTTVEINETTLAAGDSTKGFSGDTEYVPQYYNGIEIPPLGARIIPLERQVQIAKEANLSPTQNKRKSRISISSILSINSRRKSNNTSHTSNSSIINHNTNNNNTNNTLNQIRESNAANEEDVSYSSKPN